MIYNKFINALINFGAVKNSVHTTDVIIVLLIICFHCGSIKLCAAIYPLINTPVKPPPGYEANPNFWTDLNLCGLSSVFYRTQAI